MIRRLWLLFALAWFILMMLGRDFHTMTFAELAWVLAPVWVGWTAIACFRFVVWGSPLRKRGVSRVYSHRTR